MAGNTKTAAPAGPGALAALPPAEGLQQLFAQLSERQQHNYHCFMQQGGRESLHDFRVSVRRLRSLLRNYRRVLHIDDTLVEQLRGQQQQTNHARDLEVFVAQLQCHCPDHPQLIHLQRQLQEAYSQLREELAQIPPSLLNYSLSKRTNKYATLGELCSHIGTQQLLRMKREFKALRRGWDEALVHLLRIHGKRLRYLLEPFADTPKVSAALKELRQMQDQLGDYRDHQLLLQHLKLLGDDEETVTLITLLQRQQQQCG